jgi:hypothetical protein
VVEETAKRRGRWGPWRRKNPEWEASAESLVVEADLVVEVDLVFGELGRLCRFVRGLEGALYFALAELFALILAVALAATLRVTHTVWDGTTPLNLPGGGGLMSYSP